MQTWLQMANIAITEATRSQHTHVSKYSASSQCGKYSRAAGVQHVPACAGPCRRSHRVPECGTMTMPARSCTAEQQLKVGRQVRCSTVACGHQSRDCSPRISDFADLLLSSRSKVQSKYHMLIRLDHERTSVTSTGAIDFSYCSKFCDASRACSTKVFNDDVSQERCCC